MHHYLLAHANRLAEKPALIGVRDRWTYGQLSSRAEKLASQLWDAGLAVGDRVVVELHPGPDAVALLCALSMTGLVYVPVSPALPPQRTADIARTAEASLFIHSRDDAIELLPRDLATGRLSHGELVMSRTAPKPPERHRPVLETDLAYIIFTSGTTGKPKGIMMTHRAVLAFWRGLHHHCALGEQDIVGTIAPLCFDFSILDMGCALGSGASLLFVPPLLPHQPAALVDYLATRGVTQMNGVPSIWRPCLREGAEVLAPLVRLRSMLYAGEAFTVPEIVRLQSALPRLRIINCFGQSESIACSFRDVDNPIEASLEKVPFGQGHPGVDLILLDEDGVAIAEPGRVGELYLRGASLFSGYWKDPAATRAALVPDPLFPHSGARAFKTGDLASRDGRGDFLFHGRVDQQVKILGNRVELEEIERQLGSHPAVASCCVAAIDGDDGTELIAFITVSGGQAGDVIPSLRDRCAAALPYYMMPATFRVAQELPITANGKVDRRRLIDAEHTRRRPSHQ
ncbi:MAG TPA: AMP-binding protein [Kofleriaceae bacterium]|nr:AMP-binding protein [Kofleriaceae bacterium]